MPGIRAKTSPLIARQTPYPPDAQETVRALRNLRFPGADAIAQGLENLSASIQSLHQAARQNPPEIHDLVVTDGTTGRVLAAIGQYEKKGIVTSGGYFSELYAGDPYGTGDPAEAILSVTKDGKVQIGQGGWADILDPFGRSAAWIGTQADTLAVTGAANSGGLIRLTVVAHTLSTGDTPAVLNVGGVPNATGVWTVTKIDVDHIDLQNSVWDGTYTSGGTVNRVLHISGVANNGAGKIRVTTAVNHTYETGDEVNIVGVGGVTAANAQWIITRIDATNFDLQGSTFSGGYTSGGACLRYFAGMLAQTIAIGQSFANYKLRAFADGSFRIRDSSAGITTSIGNTSIGGVGVVGIEIQDNTTGDAMVESPTFVALWTTDPNNGRVAAAMGRNGDAGIVKAYDGTGVGHIDGQGLRCVLDGSNGNITCDGGVFATTNSGFGGKVGPAYAIDTQGDINISGVYRKGTTPGISLTRNMGTSLTVTTGSAVTGAPGVGQGTGSFVTGVTLVTTPTTFSGGIVTA